jgi:hypothetical protein
MPEFNHPPGQEPQRPSRLPIGRSGAGQRDQMRLLLPVELSRVDALAATIRAQRCRQALLDKAPPQTLHSGETNLQRLGNTLVHPARPSLSLVRLEQNLRMLELTDVGLAPCKQSPKLLAFLARQRHPVALHPSSPAGPRQNNGAAALIVSSLTEH